MSIYDEVLLGGAPKRSDVPEAALDALRLAVRDYDTAMGTVHGYCGCAHCDNQVFILAMAALDFIDAVEQ